MVVGCWKITYYNYRDAQNMRYSEMNNKHLENMILHDRIVYFESKLKYTELAVVVKRYGHLNCIENIIPTSYVKH